MGDSLFGTDDPKRVELKHICQRKAAQGAHHRELGVQVNAGNWLVGQQQLWLASRGRRLITTGQRIDAPPDQGIGTGGPQCRGNRIGIAPGQPAHGHDILHRQRPGTVSGLGQIALPACPLTCVQLTRRDIQIDSRQALTPARSAATGSSAWTLEHQTHEQRRTDLGGQHAQLQQLPWRHQPRGRVGLQLQAGAGQRSEPPQPKKRFFSTDGSNKHLGARSGA